MEAFLSKTRRTSPGRSRGDGHPEGVLLLHNSRASPKAVQAGELLSAHFDVKQSRRWIEFEAMAPEAACGIVFIEDLQDPDFEKLLVYRARHPLRPLVLITRFDPQSAKMLKSIRVDEVVWTFEMEDSLLPAVRRGCSAHLLMMVGEAFRTNDALPAELRDAMRHVLQSPRPVLDQGQLCRVVGCDRSTLVRQWNQYIAGPEPPTLKTFLDWVILLRALNGKGRAFTWSSVAEEMDMPLRTLNRISNRLTGRPIGTLASGDHLAIARRFLEEVVTPILGPSGIVNQWYREEKQS